MPSLAMPAAAGIEYAPDFGDGTAAPHLPGMAKVEDKVKLLLEIDRALTTRDLHGWNDSMREIKS